VHMVQHELLMVVAAPLFVLSRPLEAWTWALDPAWRRTLGGVARIGALRAIWRAFSRPTGAWIFHAAALWAWHVPVLFEAALADKALHIAQHSCFLASALFFWWSVFGRAAGRHGGASVASLFTTMMHTGALGALLAFAGSPWYPSYAGAAAHGLTALEDQQLGGLVMWVPGALPYIIAALAIVGTWIAEKSGPGTDPEPGNGVNQGQSPNRAAGATVASLTPLLRSDSATKPEALASSMKSRR